MKSPRDRPKKVASPKAPGKGAGRTRAQRSDIERALAMSMLRAREVVMAMIRPVLRRHGLTSQQWRILRFLDSSPALSPSALSRLTVILLPSLLRILKIMEEDGLLQQHKTEGSSRVLVSLTPKGEALVNTVYPEVASARANISRYLTSAEVEVLLALLRKLYAHEAGGSQRRLAECR